MAFQLLLPDIGEGVVEAEVQKWFVKAGDEVVEDQPIVEIMTDKATVTIPSPRRGRIARLFWKEGEVARVNEPLLEMEPDAADEQAPSAVANTSTSTAATATPGAAATPRAGTTAPSPATPSAVAAAVPLAVARGEEPWEAKLPSSVATASVRGPGGRALATPAVRATARQMGIDIDEVAGSGPGGRVTKEDLRGWARVNGREAPPGAPSAEHRVEVVPVRGLRRRIAERMARSKRTAAHFTFVEKADVTELVRLRQRMAAAAEKEGVKLSFLPFAVKAVVAALKRHPALNASLDEEKGEIHLKRWYDIGIASATEQGLMVPVVRRADERSLIDIAREIERLSAETKAGKARPEDMGGSTFTITSLGVLGGLFATPIINYPEVAILSLHRIQPTPVVKDGQIVAREVMHLALSFDHRVIDGDVGAAFAYAVIGYLEDPSLLFLEMA